VTNQDLGQVILALLLLTLSANVLGQLFTKLRQPKVVGEILAGILLGPTVLKKVAPGFSADIFGADKSSPKALVLGFFYNFGMLMLMFVAGAAAKHLLGKENRKATAFILGLGTPLPFLLALFVSPLLPLDRFMGTAGSETAVILVFASAAAVTSIPVITKIFADLGILHTRFASLQLGSAVLEDIGLWGVLSIASAIAASKLSSTEGALAGTIGSHIFVNAVFVLVALFVMPMVLRTLSRARWNVMAQHSPIAWMFTVFFAYVALAAALEVTLAFAALLAGYGVMGGMKSTEHARFRAPVQSVTEVAGNFFIPVYFALIGYKLDLSKTFDPVMLLAFMLGTSLVVFVCVGLGSRLAGMNWLDTVNLAITQNARGGPGIVMAGVAFDAGIINGAFFTTLVLTAVLTSQACGFWLDLVLRKGWPLLSNSDLHRRGIEPEIEEALLPTAPGAALPPQTPPLSPQVPNSMMVRQS
jgi:Kef-type K+ transport system membrane component KefB